MDLTVKAYLSKEDFSVEVRRLPLKVNPQNIGGLFQALVDKVVAVFPDLNGKKSLNVTWKDSDGDLVLMSSDEELYDALSQVSADTLKIYISGCESEPVAMDDAEGTPDDPAKTTSHDKEVPCPLEYWPFMGPPRGMPFPQHPFGFGPPPPFGHHSGFHGRCGGPMRKRGHHGARQCGRHGHEHGGHNMHGHHHGGHFADHESDCQGMWEHHGTHKRQGGWKNVLREMVPVAQRRWAKAFIRKWRKENNKNTTTTTSDSDSEIVLTQETAGVPEAYAQWLTTLLPKLHEIWDGGSGDDSAGAFNMEEDTASVPMAFRKWVMWYLARHFAPRGGPHAMRGSHFHSGRDSRHWRFGKHHGHGHFGKHGQHSEGKMQKKTWKMACRLSTLAAFIPMKHRKWARCYIQTWRLENGVPTAVAAVSTSESDDAELDIMVSAADIPKDYARWLQKFLPKWHLIRGQVDGQKVQMEKGGMGEFKNTVPREFRKWVKCFMAKRYGIPNGGADGRQAERATSHYQKWMTAFQKRWLREQEKGGHSDVIYLTSSDEDGALGATTSDVDTDLEVENSMKRLKLNMNQSGEDNQIRGKSVQFETDTNKVMTGQGRQFHRSMMRPLMDKEQGEYDINIMKANKGLNREFRQWAKEALYHWDGKSVNSNDVSMQDQGSSKSSQTTAESVEKDDNIPPNIYQWMSKMMEKMQKKRMVQELREARMEVKTAKKLAHAATKAQN